MVRRLLVLAFATGALTMGFAATANAAEPTIEVQVDAKAQDSPGIRVDGVVHVPVNANGNTAALVGLELG